MCVCDTAMLDWSEILPRTAGGARHHTWRPQHLATETGTLKQELGKTLDTLEILTRYATKTPTEAPCFAGRISGTSGSSENWTANRMYRQYKTERTDREE